MGIGAFFSSLDGRAVLASMTVSARKPEFLEVCFKLIIARFPKELNYRISSISMERIKNVSTETPMGILKETIDSYVDEKLRAKAIRILVEERLNKENI